MDDKHTPGPWKVTRLSECPTPGYAYLVGGNGINAHVALTVTPADAEFIASAEAEIARLRTLNAELRDALETLVDMYVANRGSDGKFPHPHEFISCITPRAVSEMTAKQRKADRTWRAWDAARATLAKAEAQ